MNTKQLELFVKLAENKNFTRTANEMYISQPALSQQIKSLEYELGRTLLNRSNKKVELTDTGKSFYASAKKILESYYEAINKMNHDMDSEYESINVGYTRSFGRTILPKIVKKYVNDYPKTNISIVHESSYSLINSLKDNRLDVVFVAENVAKNIDNEIAYVELIKTKPVFIMTNKFHQSKKESLSFNDLKGSPLIMPGRHFHVDIFSMISRSLNTTYKDINTIIASDFESSLIMAEAGVGICICPDFKYTFNQEDNIIQVPINDPFNEYTLHYGLAYLPSNQKRGIKELIEVSREVTENIYKRK